jgi:NAD-dependent glutamate dehydrogenase
VTEEAEGRCDRKHTGVVDGLASVGLGSLAHLGEDHGGDLLGSEDLVLALELDLDGGLASLVDDLEGEVLHVGLNLGIGELAANQALGVEDGVVGVHRDLVLRGVSDETLRVVEGDIAGSDTVALVVGNDVALVVHVDGTARVGGCGGEIVSVELRGCGERGVGG